MPQVSKHQPHNLDPALVQKPYSLSMRRFIFSLWGSGLWVACNAPSRARLPESLDVTILQHVDDWSNIAENFFYTLVRRRTFGTLCFAVESSYNVRANSRGDNVTKLLSWPKHPGARG